MVVNIHGGGLGDCWASVNWCLRQDREVALYTKTDRGKDRRHLVEEILAVIDAPCALRYSDEPGRKLSWREVYRADYFATKSTWTPIVGNIAYQFDGRSKPRITNCSKEEEQLFHKTFCKHTLFRLGRPKSLFASVEELVKCEYFVGVDSGFAHVACSVGLPIFILGNRRTGTNIHEETYPGKSVTLVPNMSAFIHSRRES